MERATLRPRAREAQRFCFMILACAALKGTVPELRGF